MKLAIISVNKETQTAEVLWKDEQTLYDSAGTPVLVNNGNVRKAYAAEQKDEFLAEVEGAQSYITTLGW